MSKKKKLLITVAPLAAFVTIFLLSICEGPLAFLGTFIAPLVLFGLVGLLWFVAGIVHTYGARIEMTIIITTLVFPLYAFFGLYAIIGYFHAC